MEEQHREFSKGIWIPNEIWNRDDLSWSEKFLFGQIDKMCRINEQGEDEPCYASNKWFSKLFGISETSISLAISHLKDLGFIHFVSFDGRQRKLMSDLSQVYASYKIYLKEKAENPDKKKKFKQNKKKI